METDVLDPPGRLRVNSEPKCWISPCSGLTARPAAPEPQAAMVKYRSRRVDELLMLVVFLMRETESGKRCEKAAMVNVAGKPNPP